MIRTAALLAILLSPSPAQAQDAQISNVGATPAALSAVVTWASALAASSRVAYGPTVAMGESTLFDQTRTTAHAVTILGLTPGTQYFYNARSLLNGVSVGSGSSFTTSTTVSAGAYTP
jgi:hypothetical protein